MKIFVNTLIFGTINMVVKSNQTIADVRKMLHRKLDNLYDGYDIEIALGAESASTWILGEKVLEEDSLLADYNIEKDDTIRATFHLIGEGKRMLLRPCDDPKNARMSPTAPHYIDTHSSDEEVTAQDSS